MLSREPPAQQPAPGSSGRQYHIHTFGCQMNLADSERMAGTLEAAGYTCAADISDADVIVYNTCSIRDKAEQKVYSALGKQVRAVKCGACDQHHSSLSLWTHAACTSWREALMQVIGRRLGCPADFWAHARHACIDVKSRVRPRPGCCMRCGHAACLV